MNKLISQMASDANQTTTTNGMAALKSTLNANLDFYGMAAAARGASESRLCELFEKAYAEDKTLAVKNLFHLRDIRGGKRERRAFRVCFTRLIDLDAPVANKLMAQIPEYGRWDDVVEFAPHGLVKDTVLGLIKTQLDSDIQNLKSNGNVSLLGKWLPSENTSSKETKALARLVRKGLNMDSKTYRKTLTKLRAKSNVVEVEMSGQKWSAINYNQVPSNASTRYRKCFALRDSARYTQWQQDVKANLAKPAAEQNKKIKVNAATSFPHDLVGTYVGYSTTLDQTIENQWKSLPNYANTQKNVLVLPDVSGSMGSGPGTPVCMAVALAIYFAERNTGAYKNSMIAFESTPRFIQLSEGTSLQQKVKNTLLDRYVGSTNLAGAFDLVLNAAKKGKVPEKDMPAAMVIVSDMQFDGCFQDRYDNSNPSAFQMIEQKYAAAGYKMPQIVFWNVNGTDNVPVMAQRSGACFVSGASPDIFKAFMTFIDTGEAMTPEKIMKNALEVERYKSIVA